MTVYFERGTGTKVWECCLTAGKWELQQQLCGFHQLPGEHAVSDSSQCTARKESFPLADIKEMNLYFWTLHLEFQLIF